MAKVTKAEAKAAASIVELAADLAELGEITASYEAERLETVERYTAKLDAIARNADSASDRWANEMDRRWSNWRAVIMASIPLKGGDDNDRPDA